MDEPAIGPEEIARLRNQLAQLQRQLAAVQLIAERLSAITQVEDTTREALRLCLEIAEADAGSLVLYDPHADKLVYRQVIGQAADEITGLQLDTDQGIAGQVFRSGASLITEDVSREQSHLHDIDERTGYVTQNMVSVPLKSVAGEPIGVLQVLNRREGAFGEEDVRLIEIMGSEIAAAIESARLAEEARLGVIMRFIGDLSHDVKNMISPVQMGAETLREFAQEAFDRLDALGAEHGPDWAERLSGALGELRELLPELVEMMIDGSLAVQERMAQISAAVKGLVSQPHFETTDLPEIAERVVALLQNNAQSQGVTLSLEAPASLIAEVDRKQIYNAIYNLIFNALDACGPGATVTFRLHEAPEGGVVLECADTGPGMPPEVKARAFTDNAISTKVGGTGLGTKIVGDVVRAHAGEISVDSEIGQGTTIRCRLPVSH
jgi:signal transduction histidine kinase